MADIRGAPPLGAPRETCRPLPETPSRVSPWSMALNLEDIYVDLHQNPELSFQEFRTAGVVAQHLESLGYEVHTEIGVTGVVGVLENGDGPTVLLRADMDGLPVAEQTALPYASTAVATAADGSTVPVMHACGHDVHVTALLGAAEFFSENLDAWSGTLIALFQPAEEMGGGAQRMIDDGLYDLVPIPDVVLGQHVAPLPAGMLATHEGVTMAAADSIDVIFHGVGGHGSRPETTIDPVLMAAMFTVRVQQVVSREMAWNEQAVVTVGRIAAGTKNNIIPDSATVGLSIRTLDRTLRERVLGAIERIANAEAEAAGAPKPPSIVYGDSFPLTINDTSATQQVTAAFYDEFGASSVVDSGILSGSEDVSVLATACGVPLVYWFVGGADPHAFHALPTGSGLPADLPSNHSPLFAPVIHPTLDTAVAALTRAALEWLG